MAKETYKLIYFDLRARGEPIRLIFAAANVPYEDFRIDKLTDDWQTQKQDYPWGVLPVLEINGEQILAEHTAICRYLAKKFNLAGKSDLEAAKCDEYVSAIMDLREHWKAYFFEKDAERKAELKNKILNVTIPYYFGKYEKIIKANGGDFLLGSHYTWADLHIAHTMTSLDETIKPGLLNEFPAMKKFVEAVFNIPEIKTWVEKRPKTER